MLSEAALQCKMACEGKGLQKQFELESFPLSMKPGTIKHDQLFQSVQRDLSLQISKFQTEKKGKKKKKNIYYISTEECRNREILQWMKV